MSVLVDQNDPEDFNVLLSQMGIENSRGAYNKTTGSDVAYPDMLVIPADGDLVGVNRKKSVEAMADLDKVEAQLWRELHFVGKLAFCYEGVLARHPDGVYAGDVTRIVTKKGRDGKEYEELISRGRVIHVPYRRWESFVWSLQDKGIPVVPTSDIQGTALFLAKLHEGHANRLFEKLIPVRQTIMAQDMELRDRALFWMAVPAIGQEAALCLGAEFDSSWELHEFLANGGSLAEFRLANGRRFGKALDAKVRSYLGVPATLLETPADGRLPLSV